MVTTITPRDIGGDIGRSIGGGFGDAMSLLSQRQMLSSDMKNVREKSKPQPVLDASGKPTFDEKGQPITKNPSSFEMLSHLVPALSTTQGGMQMLGELFPVLRKEMNRENWLSQNAKNGGPAQEESGQRAESDRGETTRRTAEKVSSGMYVEDAQREVKEELSLEAANKQMQQSQQNFAETYFDKNLSESFGENGLDSSLVSSMKDKYQKKISSGIPPTEAWSPLMKEYRAAQVELGNLRTQPGRALMGTADEAISRARNAIPKIIEIDPELARSILQNDYDLGESEASLAVRPGSPRFNKFVETQKKAYDSRSKKSGFSLSKEAPFFPAGEPVVEKQVEMLSDFMKNKFDTKTDSLLALRGEVVGNGIDSETFLKVVREAYPKGPNDESLSQFNRNEWSSLSKPVTPGLSSIFTGLLQNKNDPLNRRLSKEIRGKK